MTRRTMLAVLVAAASALPLAAPAQATVTKTPATYRYVPGAAPLDCGVGNLVQAFSCGIYAGPATFRSGQPGQIPVRYCRSLLAGAPTVAVASTGKWVDAWAAAGPGPQPWTWNVPSPPDGPLVVLPGDCAEWSIDWTASDDNGVPLPPGNYVLCFDFFGADVRYGGWLAGFDVV